MWINDRVKVLKEHKIKKNKTKLKTVCYGEIVDLIGQCGLGDETNIFLIKCDDGNYIEENEHFLKLAK